MTIGNQFCLLTSTVSVLTSSLFHPSVCHRDVSKSTILDMLREAALDSTSLLSDRLLAANTWRQFSQKYFHQYELEAAREVLNILHLAVSESSSLEGLSR